MPYKTKAERVRENWMTLAEAAAYVHSVENFKIKSGAHKEIRKALTDGAFHSSRLHLIRWEEEVRISGKPLSIGPPAVPRDFDWRDARIRWASGKVLDPHGAFEGGEWRPAWRTVWLSRSRVRQLWPAPPDAFSAPTSSQSSAVNAPSTKRRKTGPKTGKLFSVINAMKADLKAKNLTAEQLRDMGDKELCNKYGDKQGAKRTTCRGARQQILTEFDGV
jgi:hypothetical protein